MSTTESTTIIKELGNKLCWMTTQLVSQLWSQLEHLPSQMLIANSWNIQLRELMPKRSNLMETRLLTKLITMNQESSDSHSESMLMDMLSMVRTTTKTSQRQLPFVVVIMKLTPFQTQEKKRLLKTFWMISQQEVILRDRLRHLLIPINTVTGSNTRLKELMLDMFLCQVKLWHMQQISESHTLLDSTSEFGVLEEQELKSSLQLSSFKDVTTKWTKSQTLTIELGSKPILKNIHQEEILTLESEGSHTQIHIVNSWNIQSLAMMLRSWKSQEAHSPIQLT